MQDRQVVCYDSWKWNEHEQNYTIHDLELVAIIHALKMWRHYIIGRSFTFKSDHSGFSYLSDRLNLNDRESRWLATTTLILWTIPLMMILTTYPTLQWFPTTTSSMLLYVSLLS